MVIKQAANQITELDQTVYEIFSKSIWDMSIFHINILFFHHLGQQFQFSFPSEK